MMSGAVKTCNCRRVADRIYRDLTARGIPRRDALDAATNIVCMHHPELSSAQSLALVSGWLDVRR